jgi:signal peptidase II
MDSMNLHKPNLLQRGVLFGALTVLGTAIDLWTKEQTFRLKGLPGEQEPTWWIENCWGGYAGIETAINQGALFGLGQGYGWLFALVSIVAITGMILWLFVGKACESLWLTITMGLIAGGILGNLYDRLNMHGLPGPFAGGVRDWVLLRYRSGADEYTWPNFNIADALLVAGAILLGIYSFLYPTHDGKESPESRFCKDATVGNETKVATDKSEATDVNAI